MKRWTSLLLCALLLLPFTASFAEAPANDIIELDLMVAAKAEHGDWNEYWCLDIIEQECGIRFNVTQVSEEGWKEKKNLAFATGNLPHVFIANDTSITDVDLANYGAQGYVLPLENYLTPEKMPNFFAVMEEGFPDLIKGMTFPDGHVYAFRGVNGSQREYAQSRWFVNTAWAETLGVKVPETLEEFYTYLKAVKEGDPNGNGEADEIPIGGRYAGGSQPSYQDHLIPILTAFGYTQRRVEALDGKVAYVPNEANYKEFLKYMNRLYTEGLIDAEYFTQTDDQRKAKEAQGLVGSFTNHASWLENSDPAFYLQYSSIEPLTSEYNDVQRWPAKDAIYYGGIMVTNRVEDEAVLDRIMAFADWCYSEKGTIYLWRGPMKGANPDFPDAGWYFQPIDMDRLDYMVRKYDYPSDYASNSAFLASRIKPENNYWPYATIPSREDNSDPASTSANLSLNINTYLAPYYHVGFPVSIKYTPEEADELSLLVTDLDAYVDMMESKMIIGDLDIDATFDEFVAGCKARGVERYIEIQQAAYDRYMSE